MMTLAVSALVAASMLVALPGVRVSAASRQSRDEQSFEKSFPFRSGGRLNVENYKGLIEVTSWDREEARVAVTKYASGSSSARQKWFDDVQVNFQAINSDRVRVKVDYPNHNCGDCDFNDDDLDETGVELRIQVPKQVQLDINGYKPKMVIRGTEGELRIESYKSDMTIEAVRGPVHISTYKERIQMRNVDVRGSLYIKTYKGEVDAELTGIGDGATIDTYKGDITLRLPQNYGMTLDYSGDRRSDLDSDFPISTSRVSSDSLRGSINGGGPRLRFDSYKGTLKIRRS